MQTNLPNASPRNGANGPTANLMKLNDRSLSPRKILTIAPDAKKIYLKTQESTKLRTNNIKRSISINYNTLDPSEMTSF
jgi:hypothetical protein